MITNGCSGDHRRGCSRENRHSRTAQCRTACRCGHMVWSSHTRSLHLAPTPLYTHITHVIHYNLVPHRYTYIISMFAIRARFSPYPPVNLLIPCPSPTPLVNPLSTLFTYPSQVSFQLVRTNSLDPNSHSLPFHLYPTFISSQSLSFHLYPTSTPSLISIPPPSAHL